MGTLNIQGHTISLNYYVPHTTEPLRCFIFHFLPYKEFCRGNIMHPPASYVNYNHSYTMRDGVWDFKNYCITCLIAL